MTRNEAMDIVCQHTRILWPGDFVDVLADLGVLKLESQKDVINNAAVAAIIHTGSFTENNARFVVDTLIDSGFKIIKR